MAGNLNGEEASFEEVLRRAVEFSCFGARRAELKRPRRLFCWRPLRLRPSAAFEAAAAFILSPLLSPSPPPAGRRALNATPAPHTHSRSATSKLIGRRHTLAKPTKKRSEAPAEPLLPHSLHLREAALSRAFSSLLSSPPSAFVRLSGSFDFAVRSPYSVFALSRHSTSAG